MGSISKKYKVLFWGLLNVGRNARGVPECNHLFFPGAIVEKDSEYIELSDEVKVCYDN